MQNVWKGMALGALVGAVVGMLLDAMQGAGRIAGETGEPRPRGGSCRRRTRARTGTCRFGRCP